MDYMTEENDLVRKRFNLEEIISFEKEHNVEITREKGWQYTCYIDQKVYGIGLTMTGALVFGIKQFEENN